MLYVFYIDLIVTVHFKALKVFIRSRGFTLYTHHNKSLAYLLCKHRTCEICLVIAVQTVNIVIVKQQQCELVKYASMYVPQNVFTKI